MASASKRPKHGACRPEPGAALGKLKRIVTNEVENAGAPLAVITVTFSPGRHLGELIDSLRLATRRETLTVCADNGSADGVPQRAAAERANVEFLPTGGNIGYGAAVNAAARALQDRRRAGAVDPEYFLVVNPDVVFTEGSVDRLLECADAVPGAGSVGPRIEEEDGSTYPSAREVPGIVTGAGHALLAGIWPGNPFTAAYKAGEDMRTQRSAGWLSGACLMLRWEAFDQVGGFDERYFMYLEDIDLGDRLARAGWSNVYCPSSVILHEQGHVAGKHERVTVPAHHESAYRFQRDRHPHWWQAPLRLALRLGLQARAAVALGRRARSAPS